MYGIVVNLKQNKDKLKNSHDPNWDKYNKFLGVIGMLHFTKDSQVARDIKIAFMKRIDKTVNPKIKQAMAKGNLPAGGKFSTGDTLRSIDEDMTVGILHDKMAEAGAKLMIEVLRDLDNIVPEKQDERLVTYAAKIDKEESKLDFDNDAVYLERKIRAFNPYPATYFKHNGERFKLLKCKVVENEHNLSSGEVFSDNKHLIIGCKSKALEVLLIQRQGKKVMTTEELLRGYKF
jgi:hypothetical protein